MKVSFLTLALNHPSIQHLNRPADNAPCKDKHGRASYANQCSIRMGVAFTGAGLRMTGYHGAFCWHEHGRTHPLRVEEMIKWLNSGHAHFVGKGEITKRPKQGSIDPAPFRGRQGIIACRNFLWSRESRRSH